MAKLSYYQAGDNSPDSGFIKIQDSYIYEATKSKIWVEGEIDGEEVAAVYYGKFDYSDTKSFLNSKITGFKNYNDEGIQFYLKKISVYVYQNDAALESDIYYRDLLESVFDGKDRITGSSEADTSWGYSGNDLIRGGFGNDEILGGSGKDKLYGGFGNDEIFGGSGKDKLYGGFGNDEIFGGSSKDKLYGDEGDDYLNGGWGNDKLIGGAGSDTLTGLSGKDKLYGGSGDDNFILTEGPGYSKIMDFEKGEDWLDIAEFDSKGMVTDGLAGFDMDELVGVDKGKNLEVYLDHEKSDLLAVLYNHNLDGGSLSEFFL